MSGNQYDFMYDCGRAFMSARIEKGYTQSELARKAQISQQVISRLESGSTNPSVSFLYKIALALEVELIIELKKPPTVEEMLNELLGNQNT